MNALFNQVINCKFIKNIKINKMEEQVNKLIEKIENDSIQQYDFNEVLDMLKDLLVSNREGEPCCYIKTTDWTGKCFKCHEQLFTRN